MTGSVGGVMRTVRVAVVFYELDTAGDVNGNEIAGRNCP